MPKLFEEANEYQTFTYSPYGGYPALIFDGPEDFIDRCRNLCINFSIIQDVRQFKHLNDNKYYILAPEERIKKGLKNAFAAEIAIYEDSAINKKISIKETEENFQIKVDYTEDLVEVLAEQMAEDFWLDKVEKNNYLAISANQPCIGEYNLGGYLDAEPEKITE